MLAVVGTLLGIIVGAVLAFLRDRVQWSRDDAVRWHDAKFRCYEGFLTAAREAHRTGIIVAVSISGWSRDPDRTKPRDFEQKGYDENLAAHGQLRALRGTLELVGSEGALSAAREIEAALDEEMKTNLAAIATIPDTPESRMTIGELERRGLPWPKLPGPDPKAKAEHTEAMHRLFRAFEQFADVARRDLTNVPKGKS